MTVAPIASTKRCRDRTRSVSSELRSCCHNNGSEMPASPLTKIDEADSHRQGNSIKDNFGITLQRGADNGVAIAKHRRGKILFSKRNAAYKGKVNPAIIASGI